MSITSQVLYNNTVQTARLSTKLVDGNAASRWMATTTATINRNRNLRAAIRVVQTKTMTITITTT